ncbi:MULTISPECIES: DsbA family protein [Bacillaceae]|uniref:DsbA family protein n=1 Tax=Bacillaceae TaxID=186817 RepID=UPI000BFB3351|nr:MULTISPECIES: DsbA family protein [Bacillaceae]MCM3164355.1 DsbA family protein [Metabacillus litoralis]PGT85071.1 dihydroneopterin aldolase [Bacillus sp. AFS040349]
MAKNRTNSPFKFAVILTLVIFTLLSSLVVFNNMKSDTNNNVSFDKQPSIEGQPTLGKSDAPVTVVEFGDFKCPACKEWGETIFPQLVKEYVDTGKVKFSFINTLFHGEESNLGSLAAESVFDQNPDAYWDFHKGLFIEQPSENHDALWITKEKILEVASKNVPNIDLERLKSDIQQQSKIEEINRDTKLVKEFKVELTPTIMVNGTMLEDPFDYEKIKSLIEKEIEGK